MRRWLYLWMSIFAAYGSAGGNGWAATPAEIAIDNAQRQIAKRPQDCGPYANLAMAYARRARETSNLGFYAQAEQALKKSFALAPDNYEALKVRTWLLLGRHEFGKARELARELSKKNADDLDVYAYLADANAELGNYQEAVQAAQWLLDLRPGNIAGLTRAAYLRELHGKVRGARELMQAAYEATSFQETEDRAWLLTQLAHLELLDGDLEKAELYATGALGIFPRYHYAFGALGQIRTAQKRYREAVECYGARYKAAPHAENLYDLAKAQALAGQPDAAAESYRLFEQQALKESALADNANRELILYYTDVAKRPQEALRLAERELSRRQDIYTLDCYAWALAANHQYRRANDVMQKALATGSKDPTLLAHSQTISHHTSEP